MADVLGELNVSDGGAEIAKAIPRSTYTDTTARNDLSALNEAIFQRFQTDVVPMLKDLEASLDTRRQDYYDTAVTSSKDAAEQVKNQAELRKSALGVSAVGDPQAQAKLDALGVTKSLAKNTNASVDAADTTNQIIASNLMNISTGIENSAISNLSSASGMASTRTQQGIASDAAAGQANMQGAATVAMMAMMFM